jgi:hypothetical protein
MQRHCEMRESRFRGVLVTKTVTRITPSSRSQVDSLCAHLTCLKQTPTASGTIPLPIRPWESIFLGYTVVQQEITFYGRFEFPYKATLRFSPR